MSNLKQVAVPSAPSSPLYSQAIASGGFIFTSGQVAMDPATGKLVEGGVVEQCQQVFANLEKILQGAGLDFRAVVRAEIYLKDIRDLATVNTLYLEKMAHSPKPARQAMQVGNLPFDALVEISFIAHLP